jgi:hypothetical protein
MGAAVPDGHRGSLFLVRAGEVKGVEGMRPAPAQGQGLT